MGLPSREYHIRYELIHGSIAIAYYSIIVYNTSGNYMDYQRLNIVPLVLYIRRIFFACNFLPWCYSICIYIVFSVVDARSHKRVLFGIGAIPFAYFFAMVGFIVAFYKIVKTDPRRLKILFAITNDCASERSAFPILKKTCIAAMLVGFIGGLFIEISRHNWLLYLETTITVWFGTLLIGIIYKYKIHSSSITSTCDLSDISDFNNQTYIIKMWIYNSISLFFLTMIFFFLLQYFGTTSSK